MPHIIVKMYPGRSEDMKKDMVSKISKAITDSLNADESIISIAIEEVEQDKWNETVYKPDISQKEHTLYKKPGYTP
jgi:4-oxalocrotonate tautomerase